MAKKTKQYVYITQQSQVRGTCKIGITDDLKRRLKDYNSRTGNSQDNNFKYLFVCEVKNMRTVENDVKDEFSILREQQKTEMYFYNEALFKKYVKFIKAHKMFVKETFIKSEDKKTIVKIIKKTTPTLKERGLSPKDVLQKAQKAEDDEFYTRYEDIEKEVSMYDKSIWKNKVVFCNCDDAVGGDENNTSAFALYFIKNFHRLGLKKLICTHYGGVVDLFNQGAKGYIFTKDGFKEIKEEPKGYTGSFDDPLSLEILNKEADIVCTNPPFSRARDYWRMLIESGKKFLIISNYTNAITPAYIPYFIHNNVWAGYNDALWFLNPKKQLTKASGHWYTNFPVINRPKSKNMKFMALKEIPEKYKRYDDSKVLIVDNNYIPSDYKKPFAVSVYPILSGILEKGYSYVQAKQYFPYINGKRCFGRALVQKT